MEKNQVIIYCDGACIGNPGPGGYAALLMRKKNDPNERIVSGRHPSTTNNRMELMAAIEGLRALKRPCRVAIYCDSQYVVKGMTTWSANWIKSGLMNGSYNKVANADLWRELIKLSEPHDISWRWVRGHSGDELNDRVDEIAREQAALAIHHKYV